MGNCKQCGGMTRRLSMGQFETDRMGIPLVLVESVDQETCDSCGARAHIIPDMAGLVAAVAMSLVLAPYKLNGREIRFLRKAAGWSSKELADRLDVAAESITRWEKGQAVGDSMERVLRMKLGGELHPRAPAIDYDPEDVLNMKIQPMRPANLEPRRFRRVLVKIPKQPMEPLWTEPTLVAA